MSEKDILKVDYFNINNKKNSILENAEHQDNELMLNLNRMELLSNDIRIDLIKKDMSNNIIDSVDFKSKSKKS